MILLDTDTLTLLFKQQARVTARMQTAEDDVAITIITWIEVLRGRFDSILKSANGHLLEQAQQRLQESQKQLATLPVVPIGPAAAKEFDKLLLLKKLNRTGRADLLVASIALANHATLVTRNIKDFKGITGLQLENWAD